MAQHQRQIASDMSWAVSYQEQCIIARKLSMLTCDEYLEDVFKHLRDIEACLDIGNIATKTLPNASLISIQPEVKWFMRPYLLDFLIELHAAFGLLPETLFLAVNLLDRYCSKQMIYRKYYQLVGCTALLISAKYNDIKRQVPTIHELNDACDGLYDVGMFTQMELHILDTLDWMIGHPTACFFSQIIVMAKQEREDREIEHMAAYVREIALYHRDYVSIRPSVMAQASLTLAKTILSRIKIGNAEWNVAKYMLLSNHLRSPSSSLIRKYSTPALSQVSQKLASFLDEQAAINYRPYRGSEPVPE
ncbi:hypothetical protein CEP54_015458 [Fusarium duplospermum]|uniref:Uncharacterized protein n=1 Tax=Fusarium duplospermum TaxID=1325734 RepID=A0A428NNY8_9HYPO|nr:hypothetical protein CEP54_015458 [Fusarium duplospermum]